MIANFALSLSFDGLRLMHRVQAGWHLVGQVALDDPDLTDALARLKDAADTLEPSGLRTKLLIPNDQIKYLAIDTTRAEDEQVREALHGATPYDVADLAYDFAKGGGRTYVAAVAKETLDEANQFAAEYGFNPVSFAAVPEPFTYVGEAFFGPTEGNTAERDAEPVIVIGESAVEVAAPVSPPPPISPDIPAPDLPVPDLPAPDLPGPDQPKPDLPPPDLPEPDPIEPDPYPAPDPIIEPNPTPPAVEPEPTPEPEPNLSFRAITAKDLEITLPQPDSGVPKVSDVEDIDISTPEINIDAPAPRSRSPAPEVEAEAPMFSSRLRADRNEGRPAPAATPTPRAMPTRAEPTFSPKTPTTLAVPTGSGTDAMPPLSAPSRDATDVPNARILNANPPALDVAPPVTGDAATALPPEKLPPEVAMAAGSLAIDPEPEISSAEAEQRSTTATAIGAASAVTGALGAAFTSRRMARADAKASAAGSTADTPHGTAIGDEKSRLTVFGARKQAKPKHVVGGKPRFLGLILTAVLLLFLLAFAALAALSEESIASWFGFGNADTQIAETDPAAQSPTAQTQAASEVAGARPTDVTDPINATPALIPPTAPEGGQVLTPEEATRVYATTGVWQRAPRLPQSSRTTTLETMALGTAPRPVVRVPASPLASASSVAGDALIATPIDPPAPDATFNFGADGLIVATEDGALTPDGILIIAGTPPLNPPTRPGTVAPEITPQDQLAAVVPDTAVVLPDAPEGVIIISGRPAIEPPVRTGTAAPAPAPETAALATGTAPLLANDGLLVLAGSPPMLPPIRPGTTPPPVTPVAIVEVPVVTPDAPEIPALADPIAPTPLPLPEGSPLPEGLNVVAGSPPILPPSRPGTIAPQDGAELEALSTGITAALDASTAQIPTQDTRRPLVRPAAITQAATAAAAAANVPIVGDLTAITAAAFRPRTRPASLTPVAPDVTPDPEPEVAVVAPVAPTGLQIAPEIAAAVQAAANRPNPIVNPTRQAVPVSSRPDTRPRNMARIVDRANQNNQRAAAQVASAAPRAVAPSGPTGSAVAQNATLDNAINLRDVNLIGIYGGSSDRRALVRLSNGRYVRVTVGDRLDGGRVTAISASSLNYNKRGRALTLRVAG